MKITEIDVQMWTLYATVVIAILGFIFNAISLWQTKKATEDMAKPYVNFYVDAVSVKDRQRLFVIKNFGQSPAYITKIEIIGELDEYNNRYKFQSLVGNMLAPGQKLTSSMEKSYKGNASVNIEYTDQHGKIYKDTFKLNPRMTEDFLYTVNESNKNKEISTAIRQSTMALLRDLR
ncbi:hypothetical protein [Streptococcus jiangjianxini]|uniref:hypothetical protein n=1 Tax=Streptococcus jiangjianxini TaxID=3161189 RepID=UPI0032ECD3A1